jgi:3-oxoacyl-[acyl-carrier-protein] synthase-3
MAACAGRDALSTSGVGPDDVDLVIVATCTAIDRSPNVAARVAAALELTGNPAVLDINVVCSGFTYALAVADQAIRSGSSRHALVIGAEKLTDFTDWTDRSTCVLVGDGAGAVIVSGSDTREISPVVWGSFPDMSDAVRIEGRDGSFAQNGTTVYRWALAELPRIARRVCERAGLKPEDLGGIVLHQANLRIINPVAGSIGAINAVVATDVVYSGNTSAGSIPIALSKMVREGRVQRRSPVLLFGFGGGLAYAGQVIVCP